MFEDPHEILDGFESLRRHHFAKRELRHAQLDRIPIKAGARVLDVAVGPGLYLPYWLERTAPQKAHFTVIDHNEQALALCGKALGEAHADDRVRRIQGDMYRLQEVLTGKFDVIFLGNTLEYIEDPVGYLRKELMPLLTPGGVLAIRDLDCAFVNCNLVDPYLNNRVVGARIRNCQKTATHHNPFIGRDLKRILVEAGLNRVENFPYLVEFKAPLSREQGDYLTKLHTTWYAEDPEGVLTPSEKKEWFELFDVSSDRCVLTKADFYYAEMEYLALGYLG